MASYTYVEKAYRGSYILAGKSQDTLTKMVLECLLVKIEETLNNEGCVGISDISDGTGIGTVIQLLPLPHYRIVVEFCEKKCIEENAEIAVVQAELPSGAGLCYFYIKEPNDFSKLANDIFDVMSELGLLADPNVSMEDFT